MKMKSFKQFLKENQNILEGFQTNKVKTNLTKEQEEWIDDKFRGFIFAVGLCSNKKKKNVEIKQANDKKIKLLLKEKKISWIDFNAELEKTPTEIKFKISTDKDSWEELRNDLGLKDGVSDEVIWEEFCNRTNWNFKALKGYGIKLGKGFLYGNYPNPKKLNIVPIQLNVKELKTSYYRLYSPILSSQFLEALEKFLLEFLYVPGKEKIDKNAKIFTNVPDLNYITKIIEKYFPKYELKEFPSKNLVKIYAHSVLKMPKDVFQMDGNYNGFVVLSLEKGKVEAFIYGTGNDGIEPPEDKKTIETLKDLENFIKFYKTWQKNIWKEVRKKHDEWMYNQYRDDIHQY